MKDAFFKIAAPGFGFAFAGNPLDRVSDKREDAGVSSPRCARGPTPARC